MSTLELFRPFIHYSLHFLAPGAIAFYFFKPKWKMAWLIMLLTMLIDLDHLFADPVFDPNRCGINFHPLHTYWAGAIYLVLLIPKKTRIIGIGLVLHLLTDFTDCLLMSF